MRCLGIDLGSKRIGVAISNAERTIATPLTTVQRSKSRGADHKALAALVDEWGVDTAVVGLPRELSGGEGPAAQAVRTEVAQLGVALNCSVEIYDERLTTAVAHRSFDAMNVNQRRRRRAVDQVAAAVILQDWLDSLHGSGLRSLESDVDQ